MSDFELTKTSGTPEVSLKKGTGECKFSGYSIPQKAQEFYDPILNWLTEYSLQPAKATKLVMAMEYMDNSTRKMFEIIFDILKGISEKGISKILITWFYEEGNDDMLTLGKKFETSSGLLFAYAKLQ